MKLRMMTVVGALAALALVGCSNNGRSNPNGQVSSARQDLQQTQQDAQKNLADAKENAAQDVNDARQNLNQTKQDAQQKVNETAQNGQQQIQEQRQNLNEAQKEQATGGSGTQMASQSGTVLGTVSDVDSKSLTIKDSAGNEVALQRNDSTTVTQNGQTVSADQLQKGQEVRASYKVDKNGDKWAESVTLEAAPSGSTRSGQQGQSGSNP